MWIENFPLTSLYLKIFNALDQFKRDYALIHLNTTTTKLSSCQSRSYKKILKLLSQFVVENLIWDSIIMSLGCYGSACSPVIVLKNLIQLILINFEHFIHILIMVWTSWIVYSVLLLFLEDACSALLPQLTSLTLYIHLDSFVATHAGKHCQGSTRVW